jgi:tetratricopeptide (TPR) repeat protein
LLDNLRRVVQRAPQFGPAWLRLGEAEFKAGRYDEAAKAWQKARDVPVTEPTPAAIRHVTEIPLSAYASLHLARESRNSIFLLRLASKADLAINAEWNEYLTRRALEFDASNPEVVLKLARILRTVERNEEALELTNNGGAVEVLRNTGGNARKSIEIRVVGTRSNRDGLGTRLTVTAGGRTQVREIKSGSSYLGQNDLRAHVGLGEAARVDRIDVRWPAGQTESIRDVAPNQVVTVTEGQGITARAPFSGR